MSLVADYDSSNSSSESNSDKELGPAVQKTPSPAFKLPMPNFEGNVAKVESKGSVFSNPFLEEETAKEALLEKHVKMVETKSNVAVINGKRICWNYRKGKCRFGHNCKFAHDSDIQKTEEDLQAEKDTAKATAVVCHGMHLSQTSAMSQLTTQDLEQVEEGSVNRQKRKRPGLAQGLVPGKKVIQSYMKHKV